MYTKYYGLTRKPFTLTPDSATVFMSETHQEGLAILKYGILSKKCFLVLTADVGSGKTTLLQALVDNLGKDIYLCLLNNPILLRDEFFSYLAKKFHLPWDGNKAMFLVAFSAFLKECHEKDERVLLIIDEAHVLPVDLLEEIRLLSNLEEKGQDVFSIFLVGQPELNDRMSDDRLLPLRQRIGIRFHLKRFSLGETRQYILFRLRKAGGRHMHIFSEEAIALIHSVSKGTPRLINIVCDHALLTGFAESKPVINGDLIRESVHDLHFPGEGSPLPVAKGLNRGGKRLVQGLVVGLFVLVSFLVLIELIPATRHFSLLPMFLPDSWIHSLHQLFGPVGG